MEPLSQPLGAENSQQAQSIPGVGCSKFGMDLQVGEGGGGEAEVQGSGGSKLAAALALLLFPSCLG